MTGALDTLSYLTKTMLRYQRLTLIPVISIQLIGLIHQGQWQSGCHQMGFSYIFYFSYNVEPSYFSIKACCNLYEPALPGQYTVFTHL